MNYLQKATKVLLAHLLIIAILLATNFFGKSNLLTALIVFASVVASISYIRLGYKSLKYEGKKIGGSTFIVIGILGTIFFGVYSFIILAMLPFLI